MHVTKGARAARSRRASAVAVVVAAVSAAGCGTRTLDLEPLATVTRPTVAARPADPGASPQLAAVPMRDTAGLASDEPPVRPDLLAPALAAVRQLAPRATSATRVGVFPTFISVSVIDPDRQGRKIDISYFADGRASVGSPAFTDDDTFPLSIVDPNVAVALVAGVQQRLPTPSITYLTLDTGLSYGFGLVWYARLQDARGDLATLFGDPRDGTIVAVDAA